MGGRVINEYLETRTQRRARIYLNYDGGIRQRENSEPGWVGCYEAGRAEISSILSIGRRARFRMCSGSSMRGARFFMQSRTFSSVFIFMNLHSLQRQLSVGMRMTSNVGAQMNSLPGHSFCIR